MMRKFSLMFLVLAALTMAGMLGATCVIGDAPDKNPDCLFFCD
jgi:hypothetical protein